MAEASQKKMVIKQAFQRVGIDPHQLLTEDQFNSAMDTLVSQNSQKKSPKNFQFFPKNNQNPA